MGNVENEVKRDEEVEVQTEHPVVGIWKYIHNLEARVKQLESSLNPKKGKGE